LAFVASEFERHHITLEYSDKPSSKSSAKHCRLSGPVAPDFPTTIE